MPDVQPDVSIVIVSWNTRGLLRECLESVFANLHSVDAEVFVVDNASGDGSAEMVQHDFPQVRLIRNSANRGFAAANNQAMRLARGRHVLLLNSDTVVLGDAIARSVMAMDRDPHTAVLGCQVLNTDGSVQHTCFRDPDLRALALVTTGLHRLPRPNCLGWHAYRGWDRQGERDVDVVTGCFMLVRRAAIEAVGLFDEQFFFYAEEADWCRRFRDGGWRVRFAPVGQIVHHGGASAMQLDDRRTVMLGEALVRLLHKRRGRAVASFAWLLLLLFNASRSVIWTLAAATTFNRDAAGRAMRFAGATRRFLDAWPAPANSQKPSQAPTNVEVRTNPRRYSKAYQRANSPQASMTDVEKKMNAEPRRRVLAIASGGGHWVQLLRLRPALACHDVTYVTVHRASRDEIGDEPFIVVPDATRWTRLRLLVLCIRMFLIVARRRPEVVVSTGAAPGYFGILFGRLFGARTIWLDSIANVEHLSLSGQKARRIADTTLTQWSHLADNDDAGLVFAGAVV